MRQTPCEGELYRHFKGNIYRIVAIAQHSETGERLVIYKSEEDDNACYARPLSMFLSEVDKDKYPFEKAKYRFTLVDDKEEDYDNQEVHLDPLLEAFLDASSYEEKLDKYYAMRGKADLNMLSYVAMSLDLEVSKEDVDEQYLEILNCLKTMEKFECNRLRP